MFDYKVVENDKAGGTSFHDVTVVVSAKKLKKLLGNPGEGDGYKVSGSYTVTDGEHFFTIYDWKQTTLYDKYTYYGKKAKDVKVFWNSEKVHLHIGHFREDLAFAIELATYLMYKCN